MGDPVLATIKCVLPTSRCIYFHFRLSRSIQYRDIVERNEKLSCVLLNCDISDKVFAKHTFSFSFLVLMLVISKVTTGMAERTKRDDFRSSFKQAI